MNREQKAATIEALAEEIDTAEAVFAVDYRGISVSQAAELRTKLRDADASFRVVKNSLTERAADQVGAEPLKPLLSGPTALTFVHGDVALAAKAIADQARVTRLLPFKGGLMNGDALDADQIRAISRLPSREVLYGQLVGVVASPISGLVRTLNALIGGLALALGQVHEKKASGEIPSGEPGQQAGDTEAEAAPEAEEATPAEATPAEDTSVEEAPVAAEATQAEDTPVEEASTQDQAEEAPEAADVTPVEEAPTQDQAEPAEPAQNDNQTGASAQQPNTAEATKED